MLKFAYLKDMNGVDPLNISGVDGEGKVNKEKERFRRYHSNYLQNYPGGKWKTDDSLPRSRRSGGMQHHIFMAIPADRKLFNHDREQYLS